MKHETITVPRRRDEALAFIIQRIVREGSSPTFDEIAAALGVSKSRARQLVEQLVREGMLQRTAGAQRNLRVRDVAHAREILVQALNGLGVSTALPMGDLQQPCPNVQLPRLPEIRHLPDE